MLYSESGQDKFVINAIGGKKNGVYVEIGAWHSIDISNTYALESEYDWTGISFEIVPERVDEFNANRKNKCYLADATTFDYEALFDELNLPKQIDYLQVDIEPAENSLAALKRLPLHKYRFSTITFEHDLYFDPVNNQAIKDEQKEILLGLGYVLAQENAVEPNNHLPFEDWWIDPSVVKL